MNNDWMMNDFVLLDEEVIPEATASAVAKNLIPEVKTAPSPKQAPKSKKGKKRR